MDIQPRWGDRRYDLFRLIAPYRWWRPSFYRSDFDCWFDRWRTSPRCYCDTGYQVRLKLVLFGYGVIAWIGKHTGPIPCPCDDAIHGLHRDKESALYDPECGCDEEKTPVHRGEGRR